MSKINFLAPIKFLNDFFLIFGPKLYFWSISISDRKFFLPKFQFQISKISISVFEQHFDIKSKNAF